nr:uncharacterized protein LOC129388115 isoform X1 [Dermacentor andersoni]
MITCICLILEEEEEITLLRALRVGGECQRPRLGDDQELIQFLHDSVDPNGMRLSGAEFFYLDRRLLVSVRRCLLEKSAGCHYIRWRGQKAKICNAVRASRKPVMNHFKKQLLCLSESVFPEQ